VLKKNGSKKIIILQCVSSYPSPVNEQNLKTLPALRKKFNSIVGLSDHTMGSVVPMGSVALGGKIIEKHFILDRSLGGPDASFSMTPGEFKEMVDNVRALEKALGKVSYQLTDKVKKNKHFARSLFVVKDVESGDLITTENIRSIRPGNGLHPKYYKEILGKKFSEDVTRGEPLILKMIK
jgi:pseudaminic acid synthase